MVVENRSCQLNSETESIGELRLKALLELGLLEAETIPVFETATQTAADFLEVPICILGFIDQNCHWFKSAVGLSRLGLMNQLATTRSLASDESFCTHVVKSQQFLAISDAQNEPDFAKSVLVQRYGIRAYLGVPLMDFSGNCLGTIAVMDLQPRTFTIKDIKFLELMASWSMSEFERNRLLKTINSSTAYSAPTLPLASISPSEVNSMLVPSGPGVDFVKITATAQTNNDSLFVIQLKLELLAQLTQELRTPLTSVLGMANVVGREIYGPLTSKQKEYIEIIQNSGQYLLSMVNEISELGAEESTRALNLTSVDVEMLCQQAINTLSDAAQRREQQIRLSLEPEHGRMWVLDKDKVRHLLYHLVFSVIQAATTGSVIHLHVSHKGDRINFTVSVSHPWLGTGLTQIDPCFEQLSVLDSSNYPEVADITEINPSATNSQLYSEWTELTTLPVQNAQPLELSLSSSDAAESESELVHPNNENVSADKARLYRSCESLRLLLSYHLAKLHGGQISVQGTAESGYRYVVSLPKLEAGKGNL